MEKTRFKLQHLALRLIGLSALIILLWQSLILIFALPNYILPSPIEVLRSIYQQLPLLIQQFIPTLIETISGLILGIIFGSSAALLMARVQPIRFWFLPLLLMSQAIPTFAIAPLLVIWFGYGIAAKIVTTIIMVFFPVTSNFYDGLMRTPEIYLDQARVMRASATRILWKIRIPAALPHWASGVRIAATFAPVGAIVGEWVGSSRGLGFLMLNANARMQVDMVFACLIFIVILAMGLYFLVDQILKQLITWN